MKWYLKPKSAIYETMHVFCGRSLLMVIYILETDLFY